MDDLLKSLKAQLYDRVSSPLLFSFVVSWALWNYRFILLLLSDLKLSQKLNMIDLDLYPSPSSIIWRAILLPLASATFYLFVYPYPAKFVFRHLRLQQKELKEIQQKIDDDTPISQEDARALRAQIRQAASEHDRILTERESHIKDLQRELESLRTSMSRKSTTESGSSTQTSDNSIVPELSAMEKKILRSIATAFEFKGQNEMFNEIMTAPVFMEHAIDELKGRKFISEGTNGGEIIYSLTPRGRAYYVRHLASSPSTPEDS